MLLPSGYPPRQFYFPYFSLHSIITPSSSFFTRPFFCESCPTTYAMKNNTKAQLVKALNEFLAHPTTAPQDKAILLNYLAERPTSSTPTGLVPIDEIEQRLGIAQNIASRLQRSLSNWLLRPRIYQLSDMALRRSSRSQNRSGSQ